MYAFCESFPGFSPGFLICLAAVAADGREWFLGWAPVRNEFPLVPLGRKLCTSLPAARMWNDSSRYCQGFFIHRLSCALSLVYVSLQHGQHEPSGLGATVLWTIPYALLGSLAAAGCVWSRVGQGSD